MKRDAFLFAALTTNAPVTAGVRRLIMQFALGIIVTLAALVLLSAVFDEHFPLRLVQENLVLVQALGSLAIAASATVAFFLYRLNLRRHELEDNYSTSETYLREAISMLEKSYAIFTGNGENRDPPRNDRLIWLATARMICRYELMKARISADEHLEIVSEHEEYWRMQYSKLLSENKPNFTTEYFGVPYDGNCIARKSIAIIFDFSRWKEEKDDPLDSVDDQELFAKGALPIDQFGAIGFMEEYERYWGEVQEMKEQLNKEDAKNEVEADEQPDRWSSLRNR